MSYSKQFSDEELTAFLDGEFDHTPAEQIKTALKSDAALNDRLMRLKIDREVMMSAFSSLSSLAPDYEETTQAKANSKNNGFDFTKLSKIAATIIVAMSIGFGLSHITHRPGTKIWHDYVAIYQTLYTTETLAHIQQSETSALPELKRVLSAIEKDIDLSELTSIQNLDYKRGQLLAVNNMPIVQLAYLSGSTPVALCIMKSRLGKAYRPQIGTMHNLNSAHWSDGKHDYLLIGAIGNQSITTTAEHFVNSI
jgi:anti-sigma factor RsiW